MLPSRVGAMGLALWLLTPGLVHAQAAKLTLDKTWVPIDATTAQKVDGSQRVWLESTTMDAAEAKKACASLPAMKPVKRGSPERLPKQPFVKRWGEPTKVKGRRTCLQHLVSAQGRFAAATLHLDGVLVHLRLDVPPERKLRKKVLKSLKKLAAKVKVDQGAPATVQIVGTHLPRRPPLPLLCNTGVLMRPGWRVTMLVGGQGMWFEETGAKRRKMTVTAYSNSTVNFFNLNSNGTRHPGAQLRARRKHGALVVESWAKQGKLETEAKNSVPGCPGHTLQIQVTGDDPGHFDSWGLVEVLGASLVRMEGGPREAAALFGEKGIIRVHDENRASRARVDGWVKALSGKGLLSSSTYSDVDRDGQGGATRTKSRVQFCPSGRYGASSTETGFLSVGGASSESSGSKRWGGRWGVIDYGGKAALYVWTGSGAKAFVLEPSALVRLAEKTFSLGSLEPIKCD